MERVPRMTNILHADANNSFSIFLHLSLKFFENINSSENTFYTDTTNQTSDEKQGVIFPQDYFFAVSFGDAFY
jgi:hypothetical protein